MGSQSHILDFEQAKASRGSSRSSAKTSKKSVYSRPSGTPHLSSASQSTRGAAAQQRSRVTASTRSASASRSRSRNTSAAPSGTARRSSTTASRSMARNTTASKSSASTKSAQSRRRSPSNVREKAQAVQHDARKKRASRAFDKTVKPDTPAPSQQQSRAAVYKTKMGSSHKRATRMQENTKQQRVGLPQRFALRVGHSTRLSAVCAVLVCLALGCAFLYPSAQQYYNTMRSRAQLEAEYAAIVERNESIAKEVGFLSTDAGIEAKAREEFGWVKEGENAVTVTGLDSEEHDSSYDTPVQSNSVPAPTTWYSGVGDILFGYSD